MSDGFYLGGIIDPATGERTDERRHRTTRRISPPTG